VNLLPPEILQSQRMRKVTAVVIGAAVPILLLVVFSYLLESRSLSQVNRDIEEQKNRNVQLEGQISGLRPFQELQTEAGQKQQLLGEVFADEVSFSQLLLHVSQVIPSDAYLKSLSITVGATGQPATGATTSTGIIGSIAFSGEGASSDTVATFLSSLEGVNGWANPYVTSVTKTGAPGATLVDFAGTVDLTTGALTDRGATGAAEAGAA
jgi:Tfp pilus assembly protein PilN